MAAPAHLLLSALADTALPKPLAETAADSGPSAIPRPYDSRPDASLLDDPHLDFFTAEGTHTEAPLTSEPPLPDAEPLTSEPPLAEAAPLTSESAADFADPDPCCAES
ncbi:hypothetical protein ABZ858_18370 [Streptomyces sp. NPDC047017]|uniref:hypothetical protein n=1 Tax=Streptomyces sp. NPDC047017 TaxID=3155024 RepID=UPI003403EBB9